MISTMKNGSTKKTAIERNTQILRITIALTFLSFIIFLITLTSSQWIAIKYPHTHFVPRQKMYVIRSTYGIIWECVIGGPRVNSTFGEYHCIVCILVRRVCDEIIKNIEIMRSIINI